MNPLEKAIEDSGADDDSGPDDDAGSDYDGAPEMTLISDRGPWR